MFYSELQLKRSLREMQSKQSAHGKVSTFSSLSKAGMDPEENGFVSHSRRL